MSRNEEMDATPVPSSDRPDRAQEHSQSSQGAQPGRPSEPPEDSPWIAHATEVHPRTLDPQTPARIAIVVIGVVVGTIALKEAAVVFLPVVSAALLVMLLWPVHRRMIRFMPRWASSTLLTTGLVVLSLISAIAIWSIANTTVIDVVDRIDEYEKEYKEIREWLIDHRIPVAWLPAFESEDPLVKAAYDAGQPLTSDGGNDTADDNGTVATGDPAPSAPENDDGDGTPGPNAPPEDDAAESAGTQSNGDATADIPGQVIQTAVNWITASVGGLFAFLTGAILALFLAALLLLEVDKWEGPIDQVITRERRRRIEDALRRGGEDVRMFLLVKTVCGVIAAALTGLLAWAIGLSHPLTWALLSFAFSYVPNVGAFIAGIPPTLLALLELGIGSAALFAAGVAVIELAVGNLLNPLLQGGRVPLTSFWVLVLVLFWGWMWGVVGIFLAIPLSAFIVRFAQIVLGTQTVEAVIDGRSRRRPTAGRAGSS